MATVAALFGVGTAYLWPSMSGLDRIIFCSGTLTFAISALCVVAHNQSNEVLYRRGMILLTVAASVFLGVAGFKTFLI
jgi:hypothetical protein